MYTRLSEDGWDFYSFEEDLVEKYGFSFLSELSSALFTMSNGTITYRHVNRHADRLASVYDKFKRN